MMWMCDCTNAHSKKCGVTIGLIMLLIFLLLPMRAYQANSSEPSVGAEAGGSFGGSQFDNFVFYENPKLKKMVRIYNVEMRAVGNILQVSVSLANLTKKTLSIQYKFMWFDKDNFEIRADASPWIPVTLHPQEQKSVQGVAPNPAAKSFKIKISLAK